MRRSVWRRYPLAATLLVAWLAGGLLSALISGLVDDANDTLHAAVQIAAASTALLAFPVVAPAVAALHRRHALARPPGAGDLAARPVDRRAPGRPRTPVPVPVPVQPVPHGAGRRSPGRPLVAARR